MPNNQNQNRDSVQRETYKDGCFGATYGKKNFLKLRPWFDKDMIIFEMVIKNSGGKGLKIAMHTEDFDLWADDVLNFRMAQKLTKEGQNSNSKPYYSYTTGENGSKQIKITPSSMAGSAVICCSVNTNGQWQNLTVGVTYNWLRKVMKMYKLISEQYWKDCAQEVLDGVKRRDEQYRQGGQRQSAPAQQNNNVNVQQNRTQSQARQQQTQPAQAPVENTYVEDFPPVDEMDYTAFDVGEDDLPF